MDQIKEVGNPVLVLDSGDLFFKSHVAPSYLEEQWGLQAEFIVDRFNEIGCDGVGIGENDFALGLGQLLQLKKRARFPILNANIVNEKGETLFDRYAIRKIGNLKVGIFSVLDPSLPLPKGLLALDTIEIGRKIVKELREQNVDFIIALTHQGLQRDRNWARDVSQVDLVIGGHDSASLAVPEKIGETLIVNGDELGKYTGVIDLAFRKGVHKFAASADLSADVQASRYHNRVVPLDSAFSNGDPRLFEQVQKFKKRLGALAEKSVEPPPDSKELAREHRLEFATYRKCMECHRAQFDVWKSSKHASAIIPLYIRNQHLNPECIKCHSVGFREAGGFTDVAHPFVMPDGMKKAMEGLLQKLIETKLEDLPPDLRESLKRDPVIAKAIKEKKYKGMMIDLREHPEFDHWIRSQYVKAIENEKWRKDFLGVQCENCHGARGLKDSRGNPIPHFSETSFSKKVIVQTCIQCHTSQQSPDFNFAKDRHHIKGEKGATPPFQCLRGVF